MKPETLDQLEAHLDERGTAQPEILRELIEEVRAHQWQPIANYDKTIVDDDGTHRYGAWAVGWYWGRPFSFRWWETDIGGGGSNFINDGGNAIYPKWFFIPTEPPESIGAED